MTVIIEFKYLGHNTSTITTVSISSADNDNFKYIPTPFHKQILLCHFSVQNRIGFSIKNHILKTAKTQYVIQQRWRRVKV